MGTPPTQLASKYSPAPFFLAIGSSSLQCLARSSLFAVTTDLPALSILMINDRAGSTPPIVSITSSISGSAASASADGQNSAVSALRADNAITEILAPAVAGKKKQITLCGDKTVSVIYSEDVCKIIALFINNDYPRGIYNVASPVAARLSDFAKKAKAYAKKNDRDIIVEIGKDEQKELTADVSKLLGEIGQFKFTALSTAINKTLDYYKTHKSELKEEKQHD